MGTSCATYTLQWAIAAANASGLITSFTIATHLIVGSPKPSVNILIVQNRNFESEVFFEVLDDHDQERQLDPEGLLGISWARQVRRGHIAAADFQHR